MANGQILRPEAVGSCRVKLLTETGSVREVVLHGVVYHREFSENLLSIRRLAVDSGFKGSFGPDELDNYLMHKKSGDIIRFQYTDEGYTLGSALSAKFKIDYDTVHRRFHCGPRRLGELQHASLNFPSFAWGSADKHTCDHCIAGGMRRRSFPSRVAQKFSYFGERLCSDLCGPFQRDP